MSNYHGRKSDFTPMTYTRYFQQTETSNSSNSHIYFDDNQEQTSKEYQAKRDLLFKRLFPSKYTDSNNNKTENEIIDQPRNNNSLNNTNQSLGDFIPLSNSNSSSMANKQSLSSTEIDIIISSSDENNDDLSIEEQLPTIAHQSIVGHLHSRSTIESIRTILIRELYQKSSDPNLEWLKCKMKLPQQYINPKYYSDFKRRYKNYPKTNTNRTKRSSSSKNKSGNGYQVEEHSNAVTDNTKINQHHYTLENEETIHISSTKSQEPNSPILIRDDSSEKSKSTPEFIVLDSDHDENTNDEVVSKYFVDRSSSSFKAVSPSKSTINDDDNHKEDSKYAQLPSLNTPSSSIIRPILSKHQRRKQNHPNDSSTPLVSAIDRIIDHMDQSDTFDNSNNLEQQNLIIKQRKKRKKKKKKSSTNSTID